jgi:hypothetical protein
MSSRFIIDPESPVAGNERELKWRRLLLVGEIWLERILMFEGFIGD